jgi:glycosyltransferase involved in cell wall biosynthesis
MSGPRVSIVLPTFNRSNVLVHALRSVAGQTVEDWELIVVGDACTDDTEAVVRGFGDPRMRFVNLERNHGHQSAPNNFGVGRARAARIAFLHHDDLWLPDHLASVLETQERTRAPFVFGLMELVAEDGGRYLAGASPSGRYEPWIYCPTSCWLLDKAFADEVGPWRDYREIYDSPSADWLLRAWKTGRAMRLSPRLTVVGIPSRKGGYASRGSLEQEAWYARIRDEADFRERELTALAVGHASRDAHFRQDLAVAPHVRRVARNSLLKVAFKMASPRDW